MPLPSHFYATKVIQTIWVSTTEHMLVFCHMLLIYHILLFSPIFLFSHLFVVLSYASVVLKTVTLTILLTFEPSPGLLNRQLICQVVKKRHIFTTHNSLLRWPYLSTMLGCRHVKWLCFLI